MKPREIGDFFEAKKEWKDLLKEIAAKLGVSRGRVNDLVRTVYKKLDVHCKTDFKKLV